MYSCFNGNLLEFTDNDPEQAVLSFKGYGYQVRLQNNRKIIRFHDSMDCHSTSHCAIRRFLARWEIPDQTVAFCRLYGNRFFNINDRHL